MKFIKINELLEEIFNTLGWVEDFFEDCPNNPLSIVNRCHVGMNCGSTQEYEHIINILWEEKKIISQNTSWINGRRISVVKFDTLTANDTGFRYLEICDQKPDMSQKTLIDHVEIAYKGEQPFEWSGIYNFINEQNFKVEKITRTGYNKEIFKVTLHDGFIVIFTQGEYLWKKIIQEFVSE